MKLWITLIAVVVLLVGGGLVARYVGWPAYKTWRTDALYNQATAAFQEQDYDQVYLLVRKILSIQRDRLDAFRLATRAHLEERSPEALAYARRLVELEEDNVDNNLLAARVALFYSRPQEAYDYFRAIPVEAGEPLEEYHDIALQLALAAEQYPQAEYHLRRLRELKPDDRALDLRLQIVRLKHPEAPVRADARETITELLETSETDRPLAYQALLADDLAAGRCDQGLAIAATFAEDAPLTVPPQMVLARVYASCDEEAFARHLDFLAENMGDDPALIDAVGGLLLETGKAEEALAWLLRLPPASREFKQWQFVLTQVFMRLGAWEQLRDHLRGLDWETIEYARHMYLAYAARQLDREDAFVRDWRAATIAALEFTPMARALYRQARDWGWERAADEFLETIFARYPRADWARNDLVVRLLARRDTAGLSRYYQRLHELSPSDSEVVNNLAYLLLLRQTDLSQAYTLARQAHLDEPENPYYRTTYAFSLFRQDRPDEAWEQFQEMAPEMRLGASRAHLYAAIALARNEVQVAQDALAAVNADQLLPEERMLYDETMRSLRALRSS